MHGDYVVRACDALLHCDDVIYSSGGDIQWRTRFYRRWRGYWLAAW
jgi:hypothetical protein